jgi:hypothetical protein
MKKYLTAMDEMRLDAARGKNGLRPTVAEYNTMVSAKQDNYCGIAIVPIGTEGEGAAQ